MLSVTRRSVLRSAIAVALAPTLGSVLLPGLAPAASAAVSWTAKWIWAPTSTANQWVAFRRSFTLDSAPVEGGDADRGGLQVLAVGQRRAHRLRRSAQARPQPHRHLLRRDRLRNDRCRAPNWGAKASADEAGRRPAVASRSHDTPSGYPPVLPDAMREEALGARRDVSSTGRVRDPGSRCAWHSWGRDPGRAGASEVAGPGRVPALATVSDLPLLASR